MTYDQACETAYDISVRGLKVWVLKFGDKYSTSVAHNHTKNIATCFDIGKRLSYKEAIRKNH